MSDEPDPWADLYADLGVGSTPTGKPLAAKGEFRAAVPTGDLDTIESEAADGDDGEEGTDAEGGPGELDADGQPKRRRRRRRRRGKKGDAPGLGEALTAINDPEPAPPRERVGEPVHLEPPGQFDGNSEDVEPLDDDGAGDPLDEVVDAPEVEETSPTAARELIADWNVPPWQQLVANLYRPDR